MAALRPLPPRHESSRNSERWIFGPARRSVWSRPSSRRNPSVRQLRKTRFPEISPGKYSEKLSPRLGSARAGPNLRPTGRRKIWIQPVTAPFSWHRVRRLLKRRFRRKSTPGKICQHSVLLTVQITPPRNPNRPAAPEILLSTVCAYAFSGRVRPLGGFGGDWAKPWWESARHSPRTEARGSSAAPAAGV